MKKQLTSVKKVVAFLVNALTLERKNEIKNCETEDLISYHHNLGKHIRNEFGLWGKNDRLLKDCLRIQRTRYVADYRSCREYYKRNNVAIKTMHPDDASMVVLQELKRKLQK